MNRNDFVDSLRQYNTSHNTNLPNIKKPTQTQTRRNIKNNVSPSSKRYNGNIKALIATGLIVATIAGGAAFNYANIKNRNSYDLENQIKTEAFEKMVHNLTVNDVTFDGNNFNMSIESDRANLYKVLNETDIDETLNQYFANPNSENKENLENRKKEVADHMFKTLKAVIADGAKCDIDNVRITFTDRELNVHTPENNITYWSDRGLYNDEQISTHLKNIIRPIAEAYAETDTSKLDLKRLCDLYKDLKGIIIKNNMVIKDSKLYLQGLKDGKLYNYNGEFLGHPQINENNDNER